MFRDLVIKNRSYRKFDETKRISSEELRELVDVGHLVPSGANLQPLRFITISSKEKCDEVFPTLRWAAYLKEGGTPTEGQRPTAYIMILAPSGQNRGVEEGITGQTILLAAAEKGIGGCFIGSIIRPELAKIVPIPDGYDVKYVLALGYPTEKVVLEEISIGDDIKYYRDENLVHHVPKIKTEELIFTELRGDKS